MRPDLKGLEITKGELKRATGLSSITYLGSNLVEDTIFLTIFVYFLWVLVVSFSTNSLSFIFYIFSEILASFQEGNWLSFTIWLLFACFPLIFVLLRSGAHILELKAIQNNPCLMSLLDEVDKYQRILRNIDVLDQLSAVGNPISLNERKKVIEALKTTRSSLLRALNTERILRENPSFKPENFATNLTAMRALQVSQKASEFGELLNEALQIGASVEKEMRKLNPE